VRVLDSPSGASKSGASQTVRAKYKDGKLHPDEPLDLADGADVEIVVRQKAKD
jgi:predicted DNA-binding antitoxin AbrB/MazE fold protein